MKKPYDRPIFFAGWKGPAQCYSYRFWKFQDKATTAIFGKFTICKTCRAAGFAVQVYSRFLARLGPEGTGCTSRGTLRYHGTTDTGRGLILLKFKAAKSRAEVTICTCGVSVVTSGMAGSRRVCCQVDCIRMGGAYTCVHDDIIDAWSMVNQIVIA